ncbi:MAG: amidohydrolase family protein [Caldisericota bacterium]|nr:amidohydrolase family protein [Caldisericota bacterium]
MILVEKGTIFTVTKGIIKNGSILIGDNGRIKKISKDKIDAKAKKINAKGKLIFPGFIDAHTHLGLYALEGGEESMDGNEMTNPSTPGIRAIDAINPDDPAFKDALSAGITMIFTGPGSGNVIGGQSVIVRTFGKTIEEMVIKNPAGLKCAFGENPKRVYAEKHQLPTTRMGTAKIFRETLAKAKEYVDKKNKKKKPPFNLNMEALLPVMQHKLPLRIHSHRADDILTAVRIAKHEFGLDIVIEHGTDAARIREVLAREKVPVVAGPLLDTSPKAETSSSSFSTPALLDKAGVLTALMTDHPVVPIQCLPLQAGLVAYHGGAGEENALKMITINPARILKIDKKYGSLEEGKVADLSIYSKYPFSSTAKAELVIANGNIVYER